jgi:hypothetical protein
MLWLVLIIILLLLVTFDRIDTFKNCGPSAPNIPPPNWYVPEPLDLNKWATRMYPDMGNLNDNVNSSAYRFWQY